MSAHAPLHTSKRSHQATELYEPEACLQVHGASALVARSQRGQHLQVGQEGGGRGGDGLQAAGSFNNSCSLCKIFHSSLSQQGGRARPAEGWVDGGLSADPVGQERPLLAASGEGPQTGAAAAAAAAAAALGSRLLTCEAATVSMNSPNTS